MGEAVEVAPATDADTDAIDTISRHSFRAPWPRQTFVDELTRAHGRLIVARAAADVVGYANYWLVADEVHLLAIATHPDHRRRGVGARLLAHVLEAAATARLITLEVRASNAPAIALYQRAGFVAVSTRRGYYGGDDEDAVVMLRAQA
ncbi:MAG: ribosomal protein S18-alanine N-acetyltransferase [Myxococcales bacterium]|nr:ribosomal protein S18-alanine N-acetyltransferase [Myxococcales bacterium]